jgi:hypothetical protein
MIQKKKNVLKLLILGTFWLHYLFLEEMKEHMSAIITTDTDDMLQRIWTTLD